VRYNSSEAVSFLLEAGASVEPADNGGVLLEGLATAFLRDSAAFHEKADLLKVRHFDLSAPQADGNTLFHLAVTEGSTGLCTVASQHGTDVNHLNSEGYSALHLAAMQAEDSDIIEMLLDLGAKTDAVTPFEETPLTLAKENERLRNLPFIFNLLQP
jgi:ankyrin repeat protein